MEEKKYTTEELEEFEKMGIHIIGKEEQDAFMELANENFNLMQEVRNISEDEKEQLRIEFVVYLYKMEWDSLRCEFDKPKNELVEMFVADLTGYQSGGSDERIFLREWLVGVKSEIFPLNSPIDIEEEKVKGTFRIRINRWQMNKLAEVAKKYGFTTEQLIELFLHDFAGDYPVSEKSYNNIHKWFNRHVLR